MISRRGFLEAAAMGWVVSTAGCGTFKKILTGKGVAAGLRTITYNVYACYGWTPVEAIFKQRRQAAKDKNVMMEMAGRFADALRPFQSDVMTFTESPAEWVIEEIAKRLEMRRVFFPSGKDWPGALMTRLEIVESANCPIVGGQRPKDLFTRHWGRAVLRSSFGDLVLHSIHLHPSDNAVRDREVTEILKAMESDFRSGRSLLLQGDFNHTAAKPEYKRWKAAGLVDAFTVAGVGSGNTMPKPTGEPAKRVDFIWAYGPIAKRLRKVRVLNKRPFTLAPNDPDSFALSDHLPVMATFD